MASKLDSTSSVSVTNSVEVTRMTIAWEIARASNFASTQGGLRGEELRNALTEAYINTYNAILANEQSHFVPGEMS
ncbi:MAG: hypothetical protein K8L99_23475 [Anaerolineae bacterium]|nr:hypothetical protein [Anaerolineae bacterium]